MKNIFVSADMLIVGLIVIFYSRRLANEK